MKEENFRKKMMSLDLFKLQKKTDREFQLMRRMEEANKDRVVRCISCGAFGSFETFDGGHYIPRQHKGSRYCSSNVWPQCKKCNKYLAGNHSKYRDGLLKKITEDELKRMEAIKDIIPPGFTYRELCIEKLVLAKKVIKDLKLKFQKNAL